VVMTRGGEGWGRVEAPAGNGGDRPLSRHWGSRRTNSQRASGGSPWVLCLFVYECIRMHLGVGVQHPAWSALPGAMCRMLCLHIAGLSPALLRLPLPVLLAQHRCKQCSHA
jgi:hypothetical protein